MSSPLSSLKKGGRNPSLPGHAAGHRPIPFRHPEYSEDESRLLEEITTNMAATRIKQRDPFTTGLVKMDASPGASLRPEGAGGSSADDAGVDVPPPTNRDLMQLMMARLAIMEQKVQTQEQELKTKDRRIKVLEDKLRIVSKARALVADSNGEAGSEGGEADCNNSQKRVEELEQHCLLLQQQVHEMETFLADYGMAWVGEEDDPAADLYTTEVLDDQATRQGKQAAAGLSLVDVDKVRGEPEFTIDFDRLIANIGDLNVIAGEGEARVQYTTDGARLSRPANVPVTFYANGMLMWEGPFRPYTEPRTLQCVADFLDGYFPSELQARYPEGVPFNVRDMRQVLFQPVAATDVFSGVGMTLGGDPQPSRLVPTNLLQDFTQHASTSTSTDPSPAAVTSDPGFPPTGINQFLGRLPPSVVRDGKVIDIRQSVGKQLSDFSSAGPPGGSGKKAVPQTSVVETAVTKTIQKTLSEAKTPRPKTPRDITTLRVKSENGAHTYVVKLRFAETVGDLRRYLTQHRGPAAAKDFDICSTYPRRVFTDDKATMDFNGLVPNAVLHLQVKKKS